MINQYLKVFRLPNIIIVAITIIIINLKFNDNTIDFNAILLIISVSLITAAGYLINDYFDIKADRINKPTKQIVGKTIKRRWAIILHWVLNFTGACIGLLLAYINNLKILIPIFLITPYILWLYSIKLKKNFISGNITSAFLTALVPTLAFLLIKQTVEFTNQNKTLAIVFIIFAFLSNLIREIQKDIIDIVGDKEIKCNTIPIKLGIEYTKKVITTLLLSELIILFISYQFFDIIDNYAIVIFYILIVSILINIYASLTAKKSINFYIPSLISKVNMILGLILLYFI